MSRVEEAAYEVLRSEGPIQIRRYQPMVVAEVDVAGARQPAISRGFQSIAGYIFGGNAGARKVAMTAPVMQQRGADGASQNWLVRFVMPREWTLETLPRPNDPSVILKPIPAETYAAITFSGFHGQRTLARHADLLKGYIARKGLTPRGLPVMAFFDPPWTLPFRRRNEIMIKVDG